MLQHLAHPLTLTLALLALAIILLFINRRRTAIFVLLVAFAGTWLLATPFVAQNLMYSLERQYRPTTIDRIPTADAIVVLGGGVSPQAPPRIGPDLRHAADRLWFGAQLSAAGKAPMVIRVPTPPQTAAAAGAAGPAEVTVGPSVHDLYAELTREAVDEAGLAWALLDHAALAERHNAASLERAARRRARATRTAYLGVALVLLALASGRADPWLIWHAKRCATSMRSPKA